MSKNKILFLDDEKFISGKLAEHLELLGWDVTFFNDINEFLNEFITGVFDILILDIMVPIPKTENQHIKFSKKEIENMGENGVNTGIVLAMKIWELRKDIPILFLSAREQRPKAIKQFQSSGLICDYNRKPELANTVSEKLIELLNKLS